MTVQEQESLTDQGLRLIRMGLHIYPVGSDKLPVGRWRKGAQDYVVDPMVEQDWVGHAARLKVHGAAVLGSEVSRTLVIDVEKPGMEKTMIQAALQLLPETCQQRTVSGGRHVYLVIEDDGEPVGGSRKVAFDPPPPATADKPKPQPVLLAEIRGHGGYAVITGPGRPPVPENFAPYRISRVEFDKAVEMIADAGDYRPEPPVLKEYVRTGAGGGTGGIISDAVAQGALSPLAVLPLGWSIVGHDQAGRIYLRRPVGASEEASETSGNVLGAVVVIHSTSVDWWPAPGRGLSAAETLAHGAFGGDFGAAMSRVEEVARAMVEDGAAPPEHWDETVLEAVYEQSSARLLSGIVARSAPPVMGGVGSAAPADKAEPKRSLKEQEDDFFSRSKILEHVRKAARSRMVSPWSLFGTVSARVTAEVPPRVALPPTIGSAASLNHYVGLVGGSGGGKSSAVGVAEEMLDFGSFPMASVQGGGTGEGLIVSFLTVDPTTPRGVHRLILKDDPHVMMSIDEISELGSLQARNGATIGSVLRTAYSGGPLDNMNSDPQRRRRVPKGQYRLTAVVGIQPELSGILFDDAAAGTPQRWLWLPAVDRDAPDLDAQPAWPGALTWRLPKIPGGVDDQYLMPVPDHVAVQIKKAHLGRLRGESSDSLDGHVLLTRLKVAASLALLHGRISVTDDDWDAAGVLTEVSNECRDAARSAVFTSEESRVRRAGALDAVRMQATAEHQSRSYQAMLDMAARAIWRTVERHLNDPAAGNRKHQQGEPCTARCLSRATQNLRHKYRDLDQDDCVEHAVEKGWVVEVEPPGHKAQTGWAPGASKPADPSSKGGS